VRQKFSKNADESSSMARAECSRKTRRPNGTSSNCIFQELGFLSSSVPPKTVQEWQILPGSSTSAYYSGELFSAGWGVRRPEVPRPAQDDPASASSRRGRSLYYVGKNSAPGTSQHSGTGRAGIVDPIEILPAEPVLHQVSMGVHPLRLISFRLDLIADVTASHTKAHRYLFHAGTSMCTGFIVVRDTS